MTILFFILAALALLHWLYYGLIAPTLQRRLRYLIFAERDRLRRLRLEHGEDDLSIRVYRYLQDYANTALKLLPDITFATLHAANQRLENDAEFRDRVKHRVAILDSCKLEEIGELRKRIAVQVAGGVLVNSGGLLLYLIPIVLVLVYHKKLMKTASDLTVGSVEDLDKIIYDDTAAQPTR